jgi:hypothetical protein
MNPKHPFTWLLPHLRGHGALWHRASLQTFRKVAASGYIKPNNGEFENATNHSAYSYGRKIGAVSLFDFDAYTKEDVLHLAHHWYPVLRNAQLRDEVVAPVARIDMGKLDSTLLVPYEQVRRQDVFLHYILVPYVECWYRGPLPVGAIVEYLVLHKRKDVFRIVPGGPGAIREIEKLEADWREEEKREVTGRRADHDYITMRAVRERAKGE